MRLYFRSSLLRRRSFGYVLKRLLSHRVPEITVAKAAASQQGYVFLDARKHEEFSVSHLPGAVFVGYKDLKTEVFKTIPKDKPMVVYCSIGRRSENIAEKLMGEGFKNVSNLYGGIFEWVNQGNVVVDDQNKQTQNVHAYNWIWGRFLKKGKKVY